MHKVENNGPELLSYDAPCTFPYMFLTTSGGAYTYADPVSSSKTALPLGTDDTFEAKVFLPSESS